MSYRLITCDEFINEMRNGTLTAKLIPLHFANGYFALGEGKGRFMCATIKENRFEEFKRLMSYGN